MVTYVAVQGVPKRAFILTLDSPVSHFTIELGTKRNAVQLGTKTDLPPQEATE